MKIPAKQSMENVRSYVYRVLLKNIIDLELPPGAAISENELSAALSVSRTPVREALIELSKIGLVEILPQRGSYISKIDYSVIEDCGFLRVALEKEVLRLVCEGIGADYLALLDENIEKQRASVEASDPVRFLELDNEFHQLLFASVGKERVYELLRQQTVHFDRLRTLTLKYLPCEKNFKDHEDLIYTIKRRDYELANTVMIRHLSRHNYDRDAVTAAYPDYFVDSEANSLTLVAN